VEVGIARCGTKVESLNAHKNCELLILVDKFYRLSNAKYSYFEIFPQSMLLAGSIVVLAITKKPQKMWQWVFRFRGVSLLSNSNEGSYGSIEETHRSGFSEVFPDDFQVISQPPSSRDRAKLALEGVCLVGEVLFQILGLLLPLDESSEPMVHWLSLALWVYLLVLFCVRLWCLQFPQLILGDLWYHFPFAYIINFVCSGILLWSDPSYWRVCGFVFATLLFYAIGTMRSGNGPAVLYKSPNRTPSPESVSSLFSKVSFSYIIPLLRLGRRRPLREPDVWDLPLEEHASYSMYRLNKTGGKDMSLLWRVAREVVFPVILSSVYSVLASILILMPSFFVRHILEYMEEPETRSRTLAWVYAFGIFVCSFAESILYNHSNFLSERISVRLKALLMSLVYSKSLKRRLVDISSGNEKESDGASEEEDEGDEDEVNGLPAQPSSGTIINLMSVDASRIAEETTQLPRLVSAIVQLIVGFYFLYLAMGRSGIVGIAGMAIVAPTIYFLSERYATFNSKLLTYSDKRMEKTNELLQGIRILKYLGWETRFADSVREIREKEIGVLEKLFILDAISEGIYVVSPMLVTVLTFGWYTLYEGHALTSSVAFSSLVVLNVIQDPMSELSEIVSDFFRATVSVKRISDFLNQGETTKFDQLSSWNNRGPQSPYIGFEEASFSWGVTSEQLKTRSYYDFKLHDLNIDFPTGKLTLVMGTTGSGKSSLLLALLGEMDLVKGKVFLPGLRGREDVRIDGSTGLCETVAYCSQNPWLVSDTVRNNIVFASGFDEGRYNAVLQACELTHDMELLDDGDKTLVGERGVTLSGGQKQRISIARAMYSRSRNILLDDCLSAVDANTASEIYNNCLTGPISEHRTIILVSHNVSLAISKAEKVVILDDGHVVAQGCPEELSSEGLLEFGSKTRYDKNKAVKDDADDQVSGCSDPTEPPVNKLQQNNTPVVEEEAMASGDVGIKVYWNYIKSMGPSWFPFLLVLILAVEQGGDLLGNWWLRQWSEGKGRIAAAMYSSGDSTVYYLSIYFGLGLLNMMFSVLQKLIFLFGGVRASRQLFNKMMQSVLRATVRFYDSTPVGRIMNRFSSDIESIDFMIARQLADFGQTIFVTVTTLFLVTYITPLFILPGILIVMAYWAFFQYYLQTSRELKRIQSVTHSPVYQHFGETLSGLATIRAYGDQNRFIKENMQKIDTTNRPEFYTWLTGAWVCFWVDVLGGLVSFTTAVFLVWNVGRIDAGLAGLSLSYAAFFGYRLYYAFNIYAKLQIEMNSAERVKEYTELRSEAPLVVNDEQVPHNWPEFGEILFDNVNLRYAPDLPLVVKDLSFRVNPGSKVGVVGRTGAGKSTIITSLFRFIEVESGKIIIDGVDISAIGLQSLRQSIAIIPQDPTLFTGTTRTNLDPFNNYSDADIYQALRRVHLVDGEDDTETSHNKFTDLNTSVTEGGLNFSQGQRQLLCLARALLSRPKILLLDEATASIDYATDSKIQRTIREEFSSATLITVAHRIHSIVDYDKILVMESGQAVEYAEPHVLLEEDSKFREICLETGEITKLEVAAKGSKNTFT
jgi:ABC-type multidrug transport system fused ATPase/permease subunit